MKEISVIAGFRNRNLENTSRFLESLDKQTFHSFELIFVDYGSDLEVANEAQSLCDKYPFCTYMYNDTRGMFWNRAHALNSGARIAQGEYLFCADVDLIFSTGVLAGLADLSEEDRQIFVKPFVLPESFRDFASLEAGPLDLPGFSAKGKGLRCIGREKYIAMRGLDEYYRIWGGEDRDGADRGTQMGLDTTWLDTDAFPVYHQWHERIRGEVRRYSRMWWEQMNLYFGLHRGQIARNDDGWGRCYSSSDRIALNATNVTDMAFTPGMDQFERADVLVEVISFLRSHTGEVLRISIPKEYATNKRTQSLSGALLSSLNKVLRSMGYVCDVRKSGRLRDISTEESAMYCIFTLIADTDLVADYALAESDEAFTYTLCAQGRQ